MRNEPKCLTDPPKRHDSTLLIVGSAPCLFDDYQRARRIRPAADVMALNEAGGALPNIQHLHCGHHYKASQFLEYRRERFPHAPRPHVHACWTERRNVDEFPDVDFWWHGAKTKATSAGTALKIALGMSYREIILCGCPLEPTGYYNADETARFGHDGPRVGETADHPVVRIYRDRFARLAQELPNCFSMSGYTADVLGEPPEARKELVG